ncbi:MAG: AAA family ATPase, partial [Anaerolineales bacterium]|nr:AAA family ATPase [Anaerolineales bacterium]
MIHRNSPLSRQRLSYLFWPDSTESQARTNLRNLLYHLRDALPDVDRFLDVGSKILSWKPDAPFKIDLDDFENALVRAEGAQKEGNQAALRVALEEAVDSYGGDLLPSCYDDWIFPERERLSQAYMRILEQLVEILEDDRDYDAAIKKAQQLLRHDHLHEVTYCRLMRLHAMNGDTARALRTYHTCVDTLEKELGLDPGIATRDLYKQLIDRDFEVEAPPRVAEKGTALIGRDEEWGTLQLAWRDLDRQPHLTLIKGEAGIGKTCLAEEFLRWARRQGITGIKTRSYPAEGELAYTPVTELLKSEPISSKFVSLEDTWLTEIARLLPELRMDRPDLPDPEQLSESWQRQRMFEACACALLQGEGVLVVVMDDLQWCDRETLAWLRYMMDYDSKTKLMFVATLRTEEITADSPLTPFFSDLQRSGMITEVELDRLDQGATSSLAANLSGFHLDNLMGERLFQETEGNPLFVVEAIRSGFLKEGVSASGSTRLPPKVQAVIETRLSALSSGTRELANIAAVVGREFGFDLLFRAVEKSEESVVQSLDELWQRRVIRE